MSHLESGTIHALLDGEIPSTELGPIQAHLAACAECRALLDAERRLQAESDGLIELLELPGDLSEMKGAPRRRWARGLAWAASLVAAVGIGWAGRGWRQPNPPRPTITDQVAAPLPPPPVVPVAAPAPVPAAENQPERSPAGNVARTKAATRRAPAPVVAQEELKSKLESRDVLTPAPPARADSGVLAREPQVAAAPPAAAGATSGISAPVAAERKSAGLRMQAFALTTAPPEAIGLPDAVRRLGGSLRLIEGMVPLRLEAQGQTVRVVYATAQGELVLSQRLVDGRIEVTLLAPAGFSPDSLARLRSKVRE
jgi:hypothetical protein